jgi:IS5 family transposase
MGTDLGINADVAQLVFFIVVLMQWHVLSDMLLPINCITLASQNSTLFIITCVCGIFSLLQSRNPLNSTRTYKMSFEYLKRAATASS